MRRYALLALTLFPFLAHSQRINSPTGSPIVQVVYVIDGSTITTYDIDSTLQANQVGTLNVNASVYPWMTTTSNGRFLYYTAYDSPTRGSTETLWVYATDDTGSPQNPPVQQMDVTGLYSGPAFDPNTNFVYAVSTGPNNGQEYIPYTIWRYVLDPTTGKLSQRQSEAIYWLPYGSDGSQYCGVLITGFSSDGTELYDEISCSAHDGNSAAYNERAVNQQTGALGPDQRVYAWSNGDSGGGDGIQFVGDLMFDFVVPNDFQQGVNSLDIYPLQPHTKKPIIHCTAEMLEACGYTSGVAHPSGQYVFMEITSDTTEIDRVDLREGEIVATGNYIPYGFFGVFNPGGTIAYAYSPENTGYFVEIYGFNATTGEVTPGGVVPVPSAVDPFYVAQRY